MYVLCAYKEMCMSPPHSYMLVIGDTGKKVFDVSRFMCTNTQMSVCQIYTRFMCVSLRYLFGDSLDLDVTACNEWSNGYDLEKLYPFGEIAVSMACNVDCACLCSNMRVCVRIRGWRIDSELSGIC